MKINLRYKVTLIHSVLYDPFFPLRDIEQSDFLGLITVNIIYFKPSLLFLVIEPISITQLDCSRFLLGVILEIVEDVEQSLVLKLGKTVGGHVLSDWIVLGEVVVIWIICLGRLERRIKFIQQLLIALEV